MKTLLIHGQSIRSLQGRMSLSVVWGEELHRKIGVSMRLDDMETDIGTCFPIHLVVAVSLNCSSLTQMDSKSKTAKFLNRLCSFVYGIAKESSLSKSVYFN